MFDYNHDEMFDPDDWDSEEEMLDYLESLDNYDDIFSEGEEANGLVGYVEIPLREGQDIAEAEQKLEDYLDLIMQLDIDEEEWTDACNADGNMVTATETVFAEAGWFHFLNL